MIRAARHAATPKAAARSPPCPQMSEVRHATFDTAHTKHELHAPIHGCEQPGRHRDRREQRNHPAIGKQDGVSEQQSEQAPGGANDGTRRLETHSRTHNLRKCRAYDAGKVEKRESARSKTWTAS